MSFRIYPPESSEISPNFWIDPRFIYKNLERFFEEERICGLFKSSTDKEGIGISVLAVEPNCLRLKAIPSSDGSLPRVGSTYTLVTFVDGGKVQFDVKNIRATQENS